MDRLNEVLEFRLLTIGSSAVTPKIVVIFLVAVLLLFAVTRRLERWGAARVIARRDAEPGAVKALFQIVRYVVLVIGLIAIVQSVGIDLSSFVVVVGTLGIGIGLALQPLLTNFVGGLVLLVERPLKVGDRIVLGQLSGQVIEIGMRATNIRTNDDIDVIVPNSDLVASQIINWSHGDRRIRLEIPVGVAYGTDPANLTAALLEVAANHPGVLATPPPDVLFEAFADSSLNFTLRVFTEDYLSRPRMLKSELNLAILATLRANGIEIPFPQRDVRLIKAA